MSAVDLDVKEDPHVQFDAILLRFNIKDQKGALKKQGLDQILMAQYLEETDFLKAATDAGLPPAKAIALFKACRDCLKEHD